VGLGFGLFIAVAIYHYQRRELGASGPPLVRLSERKSFFPALGWLGLFTSCYYIIQHVPLVDPTIVGAIGCCCGVAILAVQRQIMSGHVDLCENGIVLARSTYWPWADIRVVKWDGNVPRGLRGLILERGWRRVSANILLRERDAVDALLREKLPNSAIGPEAA
jgi:hypothetical protein